MKRYEGYIDLPPGARFPTPWQRKQNRRRGWFVQMAEQFDLVPHPSAKFGVPKLVLHLFPELFDDQKQFAQFSKCRPVDVVMEHWSWEFQSVSVQMPGMKKWLPLLVKADSQTRASEIVLQHLPKGTKLEGD